MQEAIPMVHPVPVDPNDVCRRFDRTPWSLIEEPEVCELCRFYNDADSTCRKAETP